MPNWPPPCHIPLKKRHGTQQAQTDIEPAADPSDPEEAANPNRPETSRHKAGRAAPGLSCVARFERSAGVFADCAAS